MIKKGLLIVIFLSAPTILLAGYLVYFARNYVQSTWGIAIHPVIYLAILVAAVVGAMWATAGRFIKELMADAKRRKEQRQG
jgi:hypothetical protein